MDLTLLRQVSNCECRLAPEGAMRVPAVVYGEECLIAEMDAKVLEQIRNVACLPGIVETAYTMPDAHWGYGFPDRRCCGVRRRRGRDRVGWRRLVRRLLRRAHVADRPPSR